MTIVFCVSHHCAGRLRIWFALLQAVAALSSSSRGFAAEFILIRGGEVIAGEPASRVDDFEMQERPVTSAEWRDFLHATKYPAPPSWRGGEMPPG